MPPLPVTIEWNPLSKDFLNESYNEGIEEMEMGPNFVARHPFVYIIRDNESEMILFIGRYLSPLLE